MSNEIGEFERRLKAVEDTVAELKGCDLRLAKIMVGSIGTLEMNLAVRTMKDDEAKQFRDVFPKRLEDLRKSLGKASSVEEVASLLGEFDSEIAEFVRATKVDTADKAMDIAHSFIKKYVPVALPLKAVREGDAWLVDIDVGALAVKVAKVKVGARTGDILGYEIPQAK